MYRYALTPESHRQFKKLSRDNQKMIIKKVKYFCSSEKPLSFAKRLTNFNIGQYRFRIGDYRVVFDLKEDIILIHAIGHRSEIYK